MLFLEGAVADYQEVLQSMEKALQSFEPAEYGYIPEEFLQGDTEDGFQKVQQIVLRLSHC
ncbi:T7SS effector LXG polymorphic toxin [Virgibacillus sp. 179-BFC.A HS]|uniref:T7SS effector LXG polymorphic toxin n=1 Tax=Tigheibacillus jepli TaxID=3035914 RepID=A0ABU5CIZ6_9BACI|nr:T7SS effector LXG polymorphic toxin [Virgibacillus sp. 179-BFC.A HS]MDY0406308.1 T7SS effector LXG polymorphic toxin [Virgibacillus sp. 179-BFC.A HS]